MFNAWSGIDFIMDFQGIVFWKEKFLIFIKWSRIVIKTYVLEKENI